MKVTCHPRLGVPPGREAGVTRIKPTVFYVCILVVCRMNHEVTLGMLTNRAKLWSLLTDNYMTAV